MNRSLNWMAKIILRVTLYTFLYMLGIALLILPVSMILTGNFSMNSMWIRNPILEELSKTIYLLPPLLLTLFLDKKWSINIIKDILRFRITVKNSLYLILLSLVFVIISFVFTYNIPHLLEGQVGTIKVTFSRWDLNIHILLRLINTCFLGVFVEEYFFRGVALTYLQRNLSTKIAIIISSLLFALTHVSIENYCYFFLVGCFLGLLFTKTKSLYSSIICHFIMNFSVFNIEYQTIEFKQLSFNQILVIVGSLTILIVGLMILLKPKSYKKLFPKKNRSDE